MVDCAVVGAGVAGLAAAADLAARGRAVCLIEERPYCGGRAYSFRDPATSDILDNGQHLIAGCYSAFLDFLSRIGVPAQERATIPMDILFRHAEGRSARFALPPLPHRASFAAALLRFGLLPLRDRFAILRFARRLERLEEEQMRVLDRITAEAWLREHGQSDRSMEYFWSVICLATLNTAASRASALLFAVVLRELLLGGKAASRFLIPRIGLSELYVEYAVKFIENAGGEVILHDRVEKVEFNSGNNLRIRMKSGRIVESKCLILAVPADKLTNILEVKDINLLQLNKLQALDHSEIQSFYFWLDRRIFDGSMMACLGGRLQWIFPRGRAADGAWLYAGVISDAGGSGGEEPGSIESELIRLFPELGRGGAMRIRAMRERKATIRALPGLEELRPGARTARPELFLAGDWTGTHLPATIESAARSGLAAAACAMEYLEKSHI